MSDMSVESRTSEKKITEIATVPTNVTLTRGDTLHIWCRLSATNGGGSWGSGSTGGTLEQRLIDIPARRQIEAFGGHIELIESRIENVEKRLTSLETVQPRIVMIREIDEATAESEIVDYLQTHAEADTAELVEQLGIDIDIVLGIVQRLKEAGKVEHVDDTTHEPR